MTDRDASTEGAPFPPDALRPRVLVVDDSAPSRAAIADVLEEGGCEVVGRAMDGSVALRLLEETDPDVITCDLEMPRMDGFTFLRILQKTRATPVIVITSDTRPEAAMMALELGARDFVVKPARHGELRRHRSQLLTRVGALAAARRRSTPPWTAPSTDLELPTATELVVIGASTGGPRALRDIIGRLRHPRLPILIAQHMPPGFTEAFANRLRKTSGLDVAEARDGEIVTGGMVRIAPGGSHLRVVARTTVGPRVGLEAPTGRERWIPSVDHLLESAVGAYGENVLGVVLTGMGRDGADGAALLDGAGAPLWTESPLTAAIDGMPLAAAQAHRDPKRLPLDELANHLEALLNRP